MTAMLFERYLPDFRYQLERDALNAWMGNNIPLAQQEHARAHLLGAYEMEQMTLDRVRIFYGLGARPSPTDASQKRNDLGY